MNFVVVLPTDLRGQTGTRRGQNLTDTDSHRNLTKLTTSSNNNNNYIYSVAHKQDNMEDINCVRSYFFGKGKCSKVIRNITPEIYCLMENSCFPMLVQLKTWFTKILLTMHTLCYVYTGSGILKKGYQTGLHGRCPLYHKYVNLRAWKR